MGLKPDQSVHLNFFFGLVIQVAREVFRVQIVCHLFFSSASLTTFLRLLEQLLIVCPCHEKSLDGIAVVHEFREWSENDAEDADHDVHHTTQITKKIC